MMSHLQVLSRVPCMSVPRNFIICIAGLVAARGDVARGQDSSAARPDFVELHLASGSMRGRVAMVAAGIAFSQRVALRFEARRHQVLFDSEPRDSFGTAAIALRFRHSLPPRPTLQAPHDR